MNTLVPNGCYSAENQLCKMCDFHLEVMKSDETPCGDVNLCKTTGFDATCWDGTCQPSMDVDCSVLSDSCGFGVCNS